MFVVRCCLLTPQIRHLCVQSINGRFVSSVLHIYSAHSRSSILLSHTALCFLFSIVAWLGPISAKCQRPLYPSVNTFECRIFETIAVTQIKHHSMLIVCGFWLVFYDTYIIYLWAFLQLCIWNGFPPEHQNVCAHSNTCKTACLH